MLAAARSAAMQEILKRDGKVLTVWKVLSTPEPLHLAQ